MQKQTQSLKGTKRWSTAFGNTPPVHRAEIGDALTDSTASPGFGTDVAAVGKER